MKKFLKCLAYAAVIFSFSSVNVSAAVVDVSDDHILSFMTKCNQELKKADPNNNLDIPTLKNNFKIYEDTLKISQDVQVKFTCTTREDKIYSIKLETENYNETAKSFYEGMNIVFLKALGLSDEDARELTETENKSEWRKEKFIPDLKKNFVVSFKNSRLMIIATDKQK